jgi:ribosomal protein S18 acetylase RimI-like enzyme
MRIRYVKRPGNNKKLVETLVGITREHVGDWFTGNVPEDLRSDLRFQDAFVLIDKGKVQSFLAFTGIDRSVYIMMFATRRSERGKGYGSQLYRHFERYIVRYGITSLRIQTVPPEVNENYRETLRFYEKLGFKIVKRYTELWEHGALELEKVIV